MNDAHAGLAKWRAFFWVATAYNLLIGLAGMISPGATLDARTIGLLVFAFGVVYLFVARDPLRFAPVLWAGLVGKVGIIALVGPVAFGEGGDRLAGGILLGDAFFALGFLTFLFTYEDRIGAKAEGDS